MIDSITIERIQLLHPLIRKEVESIYINEVVLALSGSTFCRFSYTLRTFFEQDNLYAQGRIRLFDNLGNRLGIVTNAKGGQSIHNYGMAFDIVLINGTTASWDSVRDFDNDEKSDWMEVINIYKSHNYEWGGDWEFVDKPHLQKTSFSWQDLLKKYNAKEFIPETNYLKI